MFKLGFALALDFERIIDPLLDAVPQFSIEHFTPLQRPDNLIIFCLINRSDSWIITTFFLRGVRGYTNLFVLFLCFCQLDK